MTPSASAKTARPPAGRAHPSLRIIPNVDVWRPADATETAIAWTAAVERTDGLSILALSRQNLPTVTQNVADADIAMGGYILSDAADARPC